MLLVAPSAPAPTHIVADRMNTPSVAISGGNWRPFSDPFLEQAAHRPDAVLEHNLQFSGFSTLRRERTIGHNTVSPSTISITMTR